MQQYLFSNLLSRDNAFFVVADHISHVTKKLNMKCKQAFNNYFKRKNKFHECLLFHVLVDWSRFINGNRINRISDRERQVVLD